jgi:hypothetical protein
MPVAYLEKTKMKNSILFPALTMFMLGCPVAEEPTDDTSVADTEVPEDTEVVETPEDTDAEDSSTEDSDT